MVHPGGFAFEVVAGGLQSNALFTANCKARPGCHKHLREQYSEHLQPPWKPRVPVLNHPWEEGELLSYTLHQAHGDFSPCDFMKSENSSLWLKQGLPGHDTVKDQKSQVFKTLHGPKRIQSRQSMLKCYHL